VADQESRLVRLEQELRRAHKDRPAAEIGEHFKTRVMAQIESLVPLRSGPGDLWAAVRQFASGAVAAAVVAAACAVMCGQPFEYDLAEMMMVDSEQEMIALPLDLGDGFAAAVE
jgi:hypothetical protein